MIFNQESALRWLIHSAQYARSSGVTAARWLEWEHIDLTCLSIAKAYVSPKQIEAIRLLVWSDNPML